MRPQKVRRIVTGQARGQEWRNEMPLERARLELTCFDYCYDAESGIARDCIQASLKISTQTRDD